jgi:hypothetical protein
MDADKNLWDRHPACHSREGGNPDWLLTLDSQLLTRHSTTNLTNGTNRISLPGGHAMVARDFNPWKRADQLIPLPVLREGLGEGCIPGGPDEVWVRSTRGFCWRTEFSYHLPLTTHHSLAFVALDSRLSALDSSVTVASSR